jgi:hypothetical protein
MTFRPNLTLAQAPPVAKEGDWLRRLGRFLRATPGWLRGGRRAVTSSRSSA